MAALTFLLMLPILFIKMLPSVIFGGINTDDKSIMNNDSAIYKNINDAENIISNIISNSHNDIIGQINSDISNLGKYTTFVINDSNNITTQSLQILSEYCAAKEDCTQINLTDLKNTILSCNPQFFTYTKSSQTSISKNKDGRRA